MKQWFDLRKVSWWRSSNEFTYSQKFFEFITIKSKGPMLLSFETSVTIHSNYLRLESVRRLTKPAINLDLALCG